MDEGAAYTPMGLASPIDLTASSWSWWIDGSARWRSPRRHEPHPVATARTETPCW